MATHEVLVNDLSIKPEERAALSSEELMTHTMRVLLGVRQSSVANIAVRASSEALDDLQTRDPDAYCHLAQAAFEHLAPKAAFTLPEGYVPLQPTEPVLGELIPVQPATADHQAVAA